MLSASQGPWVDQVTKHMANTEDAAQDVACAQ